MTPPPPPPNPSSLADAGEWLARADQDLAAGVKLVRTRPRLPAIAAYHAQQAAEKALKAFLVAHNAPFRPTHDLEELLRLCVTIDAALASFRPQAQLLTPYATQFRYPAPGAPLEPSVREARQAVEAATRARAAIHARLGM